MQRESEESGDQLHLVVQLKEVAERELGGERDGGGRGSAQPGAPVEAEASARSRS